MTFPVYDAMILSEELVAVIDALENQRIEYAVCGGLAVGMHGYPRMTFDWIC